MHLQWSSAVYKGGVPRSPSSLSSRVIAAARVRPLRPSPSTTTTAVRRTRPPPSPTLGAHARPGPLSLMLRWGPVRVPRARLRRWGPGGLPVRVRRRRWLGGAPVRLWWGGVRWLLRRRRRRRGRRLFGGLPLHRRGRLRGRLRDLPPRHPLRWRTRLLRLLPPRHPLALWRGRWWRRLMGGRHERLRVAGQVGCLLRQTKPPFPPLPGPSLLPALAPDVLPALGPLPATLTTPTPLLSTSATPRRCAFRHGGDEGDGDGLGRRLWL
jgi:hypothetical protein